MKIYNKKVFASGVFEMAMGLFLLITSIMRQDLDINSVILIVALSPLDLVQLCEVYHSG